MRKILIVLLCIITLLLVIGIFLWLKADGKIFNNDFKGLQQSDITICSDFTLNGQKVGCDFAVSQNDYTNKVVVSKNINIDSGSYYLNFSRWFGKDKVKYSQEKVKLGAVEENKAYLSIIFQNTRELYPLTKDTVEMKLVNPKEFNDYYKSNNLENRNSVLLIDDKRGVLSNIYFYTNK
ncbi:hypothetical protein A2627_00080 [Candidatus Woesebacteria bacterium RIFCSPHIGHO2_01_FULL_39_28]|uniref:Uncharacterized protein n=1 Tax=Candidatus Woesebacteria bacterium RIFCSPHIGHO2_01_FULL_39_28 TaxID=1802496 RepID=A0A1F7YCX8_9BACT|nr:MAG: hypothetical protein A2627_00080 [Candidatus Woesebacteria bacterium RIFCSPHIGHO2_01_FULL_39_28]OGM57870.1 MAG: hypothetical protein A3A50_04510 [Candidatus Woesebacteria bacterium RIFCSPLOWO2_01_FULL_38_20]